MPVWKGFGDGVDAVLRDHPSIGCDGKQMFSDTALACSLFYAGDPVERSAAVTAVSWRQRASTWPSARGRPLDRRLLGLARFGQIALLQRRFLEFDARPVAMSVGEGGLNAVPLQ